MNSDPVSFLLVTANVGSVFEDVSKPIPIIYLPIYNLKNKLKRTCAAILYCSPLHHRLPYFLRRLSILHRFVCKYNTNLTI